MPCTSELCEQGRRPCPTRRVCRLSDEEADQPIATPEEAMGWLPSWALAVLVTAVFCLVIVAAAIGPISFN